MMNNNDTTNIKENSKEEKPKPTEQKSVKDTKLSTEMASNRIPNKENFNGKCSKQKPNEISEKLKEIINNNKKAEKTDCSSLGKDGVGPSHLRQLLPVTLCIISFATVMSILIIYMDKTEFHHQQFRLNMSRDYDLLGVAQEDPSLITYIRNVHLKKYRTMAHNVLEHAAPPEHLNFSNHHELTPELASYIAGLVNNKNGGVFFQSVAGSSGPMLTAPWLAETLGWTGWVAEPDPQKYYRLLQDNARRQGVDIIHACLSPTGYPKEVTLHHEDDSEVRINSVLEEESTTFFTRVKCFPLYTLLLAVNQTNLDVLSLGCMGQELEVLQTFPFHKVNVNIITIHLSHHFEEHTDEQKRYMKRVTKFLLGKSFKLKRQFFKNYVYQRMGNNNSRDPGTL